MPAAKPPELRRPALDLVAQGDPVAQVAKSLGISESCLRRWRSQTGVDVDVDAGGVKGLSGAEKWELVELRRKNPVLETEVETLKRASAYFAREHRLPIMAFRLVFELAADRCLRRGGLSGAERV